MKRKVLSCVLVGILVLTLMGCSSEDEEVASIATEMLPEDAIDGEASEMVSGEVTVIGQVISVSGNMITVQVGSYIESAGMGESSMGSLPEGVAEGELPEGMTEGEMPEGMTEGEMPEGMTEGEMPEGMTEREIPEGVIEGEMPEGVTEGELPEGMTEGEMPEGMTEGGMSGEGMMEGGMSGAGMMEGGMSGAGIEAADMSDVIELTEETIEIVIPVGTPVYSMGIEYDFTDIVEECYVTIMENESGTIIAVNILG